MKRTFTLAVVAFVAMMAFVGCANPVVSSPEKVYLTGGETFARVDAVGTLAKTAIYQWDGEGTYYTGNDVVVEFGATYGTNWTIAVGGVLYLNSDNLTVWDNTDPAPESIPIEFFRDGLSGVIINDWSIAFADFIYTCPSGINTITRGTDAWTR